MAGRIAVAIAILVACVVAVLGWFALSNQMTTTPHSAASSAPASVSAAPLSFTPAPKPTPVPTGLFTHSPQPTVVALPKVIAPKKVTPIPQPKPTPTPTPPPKPQNPKPQNPLPAGPIGRPDVVRGFPGFPGFPGPRHPPGRHRGRG